ncbi:hypothetical protein [uncultured Tateyamaria sp.]|uniref:hypothetical protein n=1 Tax=uncultured Tateyamaria sp. TaxID=455651 RepID=UPI002613A5FA|nr:hypothetical protein [uncultured Tateyamaria sp.]
MTTRYEDVLIAAIASAIQADTASLRPVFSELPHDDAQLFSLFDTVSPDADALDFSTVFGQILTAQPPSPLLSVAKQNFAQPSNWLTAGTRQIAKYAPTRSDIVQSIDTGPSIEHRFDGHGQEDARGLSGLTVSDAGFRLLPRGVDWTNARIQSLKLDLRHVALTPIRQGAWFNQGVFAMAHSNQQWVPNPTHTTWDSVFGPEGALQRVPTSVLVGSGLDLQITITSEDEWDVVIPPEWPLAKAVTTTADMTVTITVTTTPSEPLLLGLQDQAVADLLG